jgi:katanin p60 ATPase-containing subunit A1
LDDALRRRLEKRIYIPLPGEEGRKQLFMINLKDIRMDADINWDYLVKKTDGYSGADISNVCREAAMMPMRKKIL